MEARSKYYDLPDAQDPDLYLTNPTTLELEAISKLSFAEWGDALTLSQYLEESRYLTGVPLARNGGMLSWILTDKSQPLNERPILGSCETFQKRAFVASKACQLSENVVYGIASVFVNPEYRHRGYGKRLMRELAKGIPEWHVGSLRPVGSILYSDIGKRYYTELGWPPFPVNSHFEFHARIGPAAPLTHQLNVQELAQLCHEDETLSRDAMTKQPLDGVRLMIIPDIDHMLWHICKEEFACQKIFGSVPQAKGAISGYKGNRVWATWVHRYYGHPESSPEDNTLYILRFVVENQRPSTEQLGLLKQNVENVLLAAQTEAAEWKLPSVKMWHPPPLVQELIKRSGLEFRIVEREKDSIACLRWFASGENSIGIEWLASEKYAWV